MTPKPFRSLLPEYANNTLSPVKRWIFAWWLKRNATVCAELQSLEHLREAAQSQPIHAPSAEVFRQIQAGVHVSAKLRVTTTPTEPAFWRAWIGGMTLVFLSLILLWNVLPPGVVLQWTAHGGEPIAFRVYRATTSDETEDFELVQEISAAPDARVYTFRDFLLLPGREYVYRVEVIDQNGLSTSQTIMSDAMEALPGQLAALLSSSSLDMVSA